MPEFSDEIMKQYRNDCNKAKSNLEAPLLGKVLTPICKSCKNADYHYGTWDEPECLIYGRMPKKYFACVYGGANEKIDIRHKEKIETLGNLIARADVALVYGAGATGCMGAIAKGVKNENGFVMGIAPDFIGEFEDIFDCDNKIMVETMAERKTIMEKHADIFFIAPGGIGTMDEFFQVLTLKYLKRIDVPIVILNLDGFYDSLLNLINELIRQGAVNEEIHNLYDVITEVNDNTITPFLKKITEQK